MDFYPVLPAGAIPGAGDGDGTPPGIVAVRPGDLRRPRWGAVSALVAGTAAGRPVTRGEPLVFCHQVAVAPAVVRRSGEVQAGGWLPDHVTLGMLEAHLPAGEIGELIEDFGCAEERRRLLPAALAVRLVLAMTLVPDADVPEVICRAAGLLEHLPWARPWHVPGTEALARRRGKRPDFDDSPRLRPGVGSWLVRLAPLIRPLVQSKWAARVADRNSDLVDNERLDEFLFQRPTSAGAPRPPPPHHTGVAA